MAITVQGTLRFPDNTPIVGASIKFVASKFIQSGVPIGASLIITTNSSGGYNQSILEGSYHIFIKQSGQELYTHLIDAHLADGIGNVAIGDPITLEQIIGTGPGDTPVYAGCSVIPAPTSFTVSGGFTTIILSWSIPAYICHAVTEIWVSTTDDFNNKTLLTTTEASVYSHAIGHDATEYYWIRFRNLNGDYGNWYSATSVTGQTSQNPGEVLTNLQQDLYDSALFAALRSNFSAAFVQDTAPTSRLNGDNLLHGDTWVDTNDSNQKYIWDTTLVPASWAIKVNKETTDIITDLSHVQIVADDASKGFFQPTEPLAAQSSFNDIWIDTSQATPLTFTAIKRYEDSSSDSIGALSWRSAPNNALGKTYVEAYNTKAIVGGHSVDLQEVFTTTNALEGQYSLRLNANGNIAGFGLAAGTEGCLVNGILDTSINAASCTGTGKVWVPASSSFIVNANTFAVTSTDSTPVTPFIIRTGDANGTCYVDGVVNTASTQALCEAIPGGSWAAPNTSVVGIQGSLVLDGTMSATTIKAGTITGDLIAGTTITADNIATNAITASKISADAVTAAKINVNNLAAINANLGTITAGKMQSTDGKFVVDLDNKFIKIEV